MWVCRKIEPIEDTDYEYEGAEYQLVLRGNPVSNIIIINNDPNCYAYSSVLTKCQEQKIQNVKFGSRTFVFADKLDGINRLLDDIMDAEAYKKIENLIQVGDPCRLRMGK